MSGFRSACLAAVLVATSAVFAGSLWGDFVWDDFHLIVQNLYLQSSGYVWHALFGDFWDTSTAWSMEHASNRGIYRPVVSLAYWAQYQLFGLNAAGFRLVNLALHLTCVALVFRWLERRIGSADRAAILAVTAGSLLFAIHPSRAESVAWISGSTDLWMCLWILVGLEVWERRTDRAATIIAGAAFALAFFSKEVAVVVPVLLVVDAWLRPDESRGKRTRRRQMRRATALLAGLSVIVAARVVLLPLPSGVSDAGGLSAMIERVVATLGGFVRIALWPWPASTQVGFLPSSLSGEGLLYPRTSLWIGIVAIAGLVTWGVRSMRRPGARVWAADAAWFVLPVAPLLNVIPHSETMYLAERYLYLAGIGLAALAARAMLSLNRATVRWRTVGQGTAALLVLAYAAGTAVHARHFISSTALWGYEYRRDPNNVFALTNLLQTHFDAGRTTDAKELCLRWLELLPGAEGKAHAFSTWLAIETEEAFGRPQRLRQLQRQYDRIVTGEELEAPDGAVYAAVLPAGRRWLQQSPLLHLRRAITTLHAGDHAAADVQLQALVDDPRMQSGALRSWVLIAVLRDQPDVAAARLAEYMRQGRSEHGEGPLAAFVDASRSWRAADLSAAERAVVLAEGLVEVGEAALARSVLAVAREHAPHDERLRESAIRFGVEP